MLYLKLHGNRALTTSRIVGYNVCRLATPARHVVLQPFGHDDIERFVRQWHNAYEKTAHGRSPDHQQAARDAQALLDEIHANPHVASLATNPVMLTIIALIKQQHVTLPERV
jgi:predicted NACHT family NTPase